MLESEFLKLVNRLTEDAMKEDLTVSIKKELEEKFSMILSEEEEESLDSLFKKIIFQEFSFSDETYPSFNQKLFEDFLKHGCVLTSKDLNLDTTIKTETLTSNFIFLRFILIIHNKLLRARRG